jgi:hypothetical protein
MMRRLTPETAAAKALLLAGLCFFRPMALWAEGQDIPARQPLSQISPTPYPSSTPVPSVRPEELHAAEARLDSSISSGLRRAEGRAELMDTDLAALRERVKALGASYEGAKLQLDNLSTEAEAFAQQLLEAQKKLEDGLKKIDEIHAQIEGKGARMEGLLDLVNTVKRDLNDDSHEIAELKGEYDELKKASAAPAPDEDWWGQLSSWRYLPVCGVVLGAVALGIAASHK